MKLKISTEYTEKKKELILFETNLTYTSEKNPSKID